MSEELAKVYNPAEVEQKWYKLWEESGYFKPGSRVKGQGSGKTFTIVIPPPNITGSLHMGHALNNSIQDLLIRYKRMQGFETLWVPGTDHAGIATQNVVERELKKEGKSKDDLGREKFIERVWEWKKEYGSRITRQLRRLGASCDWSRERFTMDEGLSKAVKRHFVQLYNEGLIYRGKRIINWCPRCKTALSDIEVQHETIKGQLWFIKYGPLTVATTRPETMLGDTAIAVNPKDERYKHLIGQVVELPLVGRKIPIIKDDFVDPAFGTGAVKVTPAHDPNDYEMGMRHNLPFINVLTPEAKITLIEFSEEEKKRLIMLEGLDRYKARAAIVAKLEELGLLVKIEDYETSIGHCYRCNTIVEPYLSDQWFVKVKPLAEQAIAAVEDGRIKMVPERWTKVYLQWMTNLRDWCISRQLWWGHRIPAYYCKSEILNPKSEQCNEIIVSEEKPAKCPQCGGTNIVQDEDVFDTWFSSALWPFSTLGWPDQTADLAKFYPTEVLVTSYDIIFFWVARMIMAGLHFMKEVPFRTVYFNALVKDIHGKKMSKSWGNVIDPLEVIDRAGADALRFAFLSLIAGQGQDVKLSEDKITEARNFANKIWNASRFVLMNVEGKPKLELPADLSIAEKWIISRLNQVIRDVALNLDSHEFGRAAWELYNFIWGDFCDWFIEISKSDLYSQDAAKKAKAVQTLLYVLERTLRLLHPFMPFITEEIWQKLKAGTEGIEDKPSIMLAEWPTAETEKIDQTVTNDFEYLKGIVSALRNVKATYGVAAKEVEATIMPDKEEQKTFDNFQSLIKTLARLSSITVAAPGGAVPKQAASFTAFKTRGFVPLAGLVDFAKEIEKLNKEKEKLAGELVKIKTRLADQNFLAKASAESVAHEKERLVEFAAKIEQLAERIKDLS
jgi:valyl-tRNA synthetase